MNKDHDQIRELLPMVAAGVLRELDAELVRHHVLMCSECARELAVWKQLTGKLTELPAPSVPAFLAAKTVQRVKQQREAAAQKRWNTAVLAFVIAFSWIVSLASWPVVRLATGLRLWQWLVFSTLLSWVTAGIAAVVISLKPEFRREEI